MSGSKLRPVSAQMASETLKPIIDGFKRFKRDVFPTQQALFQKLAKSQAPQVMFITCADSRIVPELITQTEPGDLFITRNVGNIVPPYGQMNGGVSTAIEYAVLGLGVKHIIICGHSDCGAMKAVLNPEPLENMPTVKAWLRHAEVARTVVAGHSHHQCGHEHPLEFLTEENVVSQLDHLRTHPSVAARLASGQLFIHGWIYSIETGEISAYDVEQGRFLPLDGDDMPVANPRPRLVAAS
ncbi:carbonic anhydrase [Azomonas agilis]|uniref:Carbonic anhydrase n=1 Tax=Azomonas agilis TaxID=116849 RepID=A0A562IKT3_9GAMM|nr:carbonic anhydrase [Azomonas agilis]TWH71498.1 carbonic anhydrase [Azomonas agilis]